LPLILFLELERNEMAHCRFTRHEGVWEFRIIYPPFLDFSS
jgi:hypothetical protein